jgi:biotin-dependent carboxylase-like uncharacterized protein
MIEVLSPGIFSSIQDTGRFGYRNIGVPESGVMDKFSAGLANKLLNNEKNDAVMEITLSGPQLKFHETTTIVISGAKMSPRINNIPVSNNKIIAIAKGDLLSFGRLLKGVRAYIAIPGGFRSQVVLQSRSMYRGLTVTDRLKKGDIIPFVRLNSDTLNFHSSIKVNVIPEDDHLEVFRGPEFDEFNHSQIENYLTQKFCIEQNDRMGYRLAGKVKMCNLSIATSPVIPGTVQITPSGAPIVLMKDAQTTGGYPRLFQLNQKSIAKLAQKKSQNQIQFKLLDMN